MVVRLVPEDVEDEFEFELLEASALLPLTLARAFAMACATACSQQSTSVFVLAAEPCLTPDCH